MKKRTLSFVFIAWIALNSLAACSARPQLKQVENDAPDKPINTQESADQLKKKYEK